MPEVLEPIAAGVAAALKSLRTRSGLREDRLAESDLAVDALAGLAIVRDFVAAGDSAEQAIARAVRAAAQTLDPTDSIVADVILALELNPAEPDLYAGDLGRRRTVLLDNWARLHELRAVPWQGPAPTPRALRFDVETRALSSLALALTTAESQALYQEQPDSGQEVSRLRLPRGAVPLLSTEFRRVAGALRASLVTGAGGTGWTHNLLKGAPTPLTTAYGIMTALLLEGPLAADLVPAVEFLKTRVATGGPYAAENPSQPRPEAVAVVLNALHRVDAAARYDQQLTAMERGLGRLERSRPLILTGVLETAVQFGRDRELTRSLICDLLDTRRSFGGVPLWVQRAEDYLVAPVASTAHTARAICALTRAQAVLGPDEELSGQVLDAVEQAAAWLAEGQDLDGSSEVIDRQGENGPELVYVRHFTAAWVVKALTLVGLPATHPAVSAAVARIWQYYHRESALWRWPNGELPVWMTFDAVEALHLAATAVPVPAT